MKISNGVNKGLYLYCIRVKTDYKNLVFGKNLDSRFTRIRFSARGIDGGKIFAIPHQDLEAVVSEVSLEEFGSEEIQRKAQEDLGWIKEKAFLHEKVIEEAMGLPAIGEARLRRQSPPYPLSEDLLKNKNLEVVIPMKFGTIFKTKEKLEETLKKYYSKFKQNLENLKGKQEWSVKAYLNRKAFKEEVKKVSPVVREKEKEITSMPEGVAYFAQKQIDEAISREADKVLQNYSENFFKTLKKYTEAGTKGKILEKELTGKSLSMILNMIFLVSEEKLEDFTKEIDKLNKEYRPKGFDFEYSGPWPPYNFI